jgi:glycosyltransferase involved in cell wall biosynthesis
LKILFVLPEFGVSVRGGIARFYQHAIAGLRSADCEVDVCIACHSDIQVAVDDIVVRRPDPAKIVAAKNRLSHLALFPGLQSQLAVAFAAYEECSGGDGYDVVEVTDFGLLYVPWLGQRKRSVPVVVQLHGSPGQIGYRDPIAGAELSDLLTRALETTYLARADDIHTSGIANALDWHRLLNREVRVIPPGWPTPGECAVSPESNSFGMVAARLQSWKGPELLCKVCEGLEEDAPTILWVGGDHPFQRPDQLMSSYLGTRYPEIWGRKVIPLGSQPPEIAKSVQNAANFVVHPSSWDVFGLAVVEAMEGGKVVICSDQAGAAQLIEHGKNGFVYPGDDCGRLADLLRSVPKLDQQERRRLGEAAQQTIADKLDLQKITKARLASYVALSSRDQKTGHSWLESIFAPGVASSAISVEALLDITPLKKLLRYVVTRLMRRVFRNKCEVKPIPNLTSQEVMTLLSCLTGRRVGSWN